VVERLVAVVETQREERGFPADRHVVSIEGERLSTAARAARAS